MNWRQLVDVELARVDDHIGELRIGSIKTAFGPQAFSHRTSMSEAGGALVFAKRRSSAPRSIDEDECRGVFRGNCRRMAGSFFEAVSHLRACQQGPPAEFTAAFACAIA